MIKNQKTTLKVDWNMRKMAIKSIDTLIEEGSRIDNIEFKREWKEIYDPWHPWIAKRERSGYAEVTIKFVPKKIEEGSIK